jgi:hypothetical protein
MQPNTPKNRLLYLPALAVCATVLIGCAQTSTPGYYNPPKASTTQDAIEYAEGARTRQMTQAPSQIQISLRGQQASAQATGMESTPEKLTPAGQAALQKADVEVTAQSRLIPVPETFQGTLPCFNRDMQCVAQRITLTLAPNGRWRARASYLDATDKASGKPLANQGCWRVVQTLPAGLILLDEKRNVRAELVMVANNVLRVKTIDGQSPNLTYTLNRQPDIDPIAELDSSPAPACN